MQNSYFILIKGRVQGVGFRPFIYRLAKDFKFYGTVENSFRGVEIYINSSKDNLDKFINKIKNNPPPLSNIKNILIKKVEFKEFQEFTIKESISKNEIKTDTPTDSSICSLCEEELFNKKNRRYLYPFINCTDCGIRYTMLYNLPYERENSSMRSFKMCKECEKEYKDPLNRRYHAQPIGCFKCGPKLELLDNNFNLIEKESDEIIKKSANLLKERNIFALKGVGGYHFICDGTNQESIKKLREIKRRDKKPFALMVNSIKEAKEIAFISKEEEKLLTSKTRPIVILKAKNILPIIAPNLSSIGVMLAYTPLHLLLFKYFKNPLVVTSANLTDEPIATTFKEIKRLKNNYNYILEHNREIVNMCDDSVAMVVKEKTIFLRRARGYMPYHLTLPFEVKNSLGFGGDHKNSIVLASKKEAIISSLIGDIETIDAIENFKTHKNRLLKLYNFTPKIVTFDKHPNYITTKEAKKETFEKKEVQHHFAHILSVMAQNKIDINQKVLGVAFDGSGYGEDKTIWGGEFLICNYKDFSREFYFKPIYLLGGEKAIKEPRRVALSFLFEIFDENLPNLPTTKNLTKIDINNYYKLYKTKKQPKTSSVGRIFDAIASLLGVVQKLSYEGESGMLLEEYYDINIKESYPFEINNKEISILPTIKEIIKEKNKNIAVSKFFNTIVEIIYKIEKKIKLPIIISGGVFQNKTLLTLLLEKIPTIKHSIKLPSNDSNLALGQIVKIDELIK